MYKEIELFSRNLILIQWPKVSFQVEVSQEAGTTQTDAGDACTLAAGALLGPWEAKNRTLPHSLHSKWLSASIKDFPHKKAAVRQSEQQEADESENR